MPLEKYPSSKEIQDQVVFEALRFLLLFLPVFLVVIIIDRLFNGDILVSSILAVMVAAIWLARGKLSVKNASSVTIGLSVFFVLANTIICTLGNGIHDIAIMAFPIIVGFSSTVIKVRELIITSSLAILAICWLVIGELCGYIDPETPRLSTLSDFIITVIIVSMAGVLAYVFNRNIRRSIRSAQEKADLKRISARKLSKELDDKNRLVKELHQKVTKTLGYIGRLADPALTSFGEKNDPEKNIHRKLIAIEAAHEHLANIAQYDVLDLEGYVELLLIKHSDLYDFQDNWRITLSKHEISLDDSVSLGLSLIELIHQAGPNEVVITGSSLADEYHIEMEFESTDQFKQLQLVTIMINQLKGRLDVNEDGKAIRCSIYLPQKEQLK